MSPKKKTPHLPTHPNRMQHLCWFTLTFPSASTYVAERLGLRHNSVVELSKRCEEVGLIHRRHVTSDRRRVVLHVTAEGNKILRVLSDHHERELYELIPTLLKALTQIRTSRACGANAVERAVEARKKK